MNINLLRKIKMVFVGFIELLKNPRLINVILEDNSIWEKKVKKKYNLPNGLPMIDISNFLNGDTEKLNYYSFLGGGSIPTDILLLKLLAKTFTNCSYFEIGTWRGESVINVSEVAESCYTLDLSENDLLAIKFDKRYTDLHGFFSKNKENIIHLKGNSFKYDFDSLNKKFDLIFIDGDHHYESVKIDTENVFSKLIHENSIIVWHDYAYTPEKLRPQVLLGILDGTPPEFRNNLYFVSNTMCALFYRKDLTSSPLILPIIPDKTFEINIKSNYLIT